MTFHAIGAAGFPQAIFPLVRFAGRSPAVAFGGETSHEQGEVDDALLSLAEPRDLETVESSRSLAVLRAKSHFSIRQTDDGRTEIKFKSSLKFNYEFQSDDGTTVKLSAKLKTRVSYEQVGEDSFELKTRVKLQLSVVQKTVQSGLDPLLGLEEVGGLAQDLLSSALDGFGDVLDRLTTLFLDDAIAGDDLLVDVVDAFNQLTRSAQTALPPEEVPPIVPAEATPLEVSGEVLEVPAPPAPAADQGVSPADVPTDVPAVQDEVPAAAGEVEVPSDAEPAAGETENAPEIVDAAPEPETPAVTEFLSRQAVFVNLRVKFVQSLSQLVGVLDAPSEGGGLSIVGTSLRTHMKLDLRLAAYTQTQAWIESPPGSVVDAEA